MAQPPDSHHADTDRRPTVESQLSPALRTSVHSLVDQLPLDSQITLLRVIRSLRHDPTACPMGGAGPSRPPTSVLLHAWLDVLTEDAVGALDRLLRLWLSPRQRHATDETLPLALGSLLSILLWWA